MMLFKAIKKGSEFFLRTPTQKNNITLKKKSQMFFEKMSDYLLVKVFGEDILNHEYEPEYIYTYTIYLDKDVKTICKIYDFEKFRKESTNGNIKRNIK